MKKRTSICLLIFFLAFAPPLFAIVRESDTARFTRGFQRVLVAPLQLPFQVLASVARPPFPLGMVGGVLQGTVQTVTNVVGGTFDMAAAAAPYAKYAALFFI